MRAAIEDEIEATFAFIDEGATYQDFADRIENKLIPFCQQRPLILSQQLASRFDLGNVIPLTVATSVNYEGSMIDVPVRLNDIRLTEGNFEGYCFSAHSFRVNSGSSNFHWQLLITYPDGSLQTRTYSQSEVSIRPEMLSSNIASLTFVPLVAPGAGIEEAAIEEVEDASFYDLFGRRILRPVDGRVMIYRGKKILRVRQ